MKINSLNLNAFFVAAQMGHFTRASEALHITQSALSQRVAKLEEELEVTLFIREKKNLRLTDAGHRLLRFCQVSEAIESDLFKELKGDGHAYAGPINIGCFSSIGRSLVIPAMRTLIVKNPMLSLKLMTEEVTSLTGLLSNASADYILTTDPTDNSDIESLFLGYEINVLVKSKKYQAKNIYLDHDRNDLTTKQYFSKNNLKFQPENFHYLDDVYGLIDGVKQGLGCAVLPSHLIIGERDLEVLNPSKHLKVPVYLQFFKQSYYRQIHKEVITSLQDYISSKLNASLL